MVQKETLKFEDIGATLRSFREKSGAGLNEFAKKINWDPSRLSRYENNERAISLSDINIISNGLNIPSLEIIMQYLKSKYTELSSPHNRISQLFDELLDEIRES